MGRLCAAVLLSATPAHADIFSWGGGGFSDALNSTGSVCSINGKQLIACKCEQQSEMVQVTEACPGINGAFHDEGCRIEGKTSEGWVVLCVDVIGGNFCDICGCTNNVFGSWQTYNSNRVRRVIQTPTDDRFACLYNETYGYGCASGYYTTSSTGTSSMTCSRCPGLTLSTGTSRAGNSSTGNLSITGCYQPTGTTFKDSVGQYQFTSSCNYTK